jgi:hypothetical protein
MKEKEYTFLIGYQNETKTPSIVHPVPGFSTKLGRVFTKLCQPITIQL